MARLRYNIIVFPKLNAPRNPNFRESDIFFTLRGGNFGDATVKIGSNPPQPAAPFTTIVADNLAAGSYDILYSDDTLTNQKIATVLMNSDTEGCTIDNYDNGTQTASPFSINLDVEEDSLYIFSAPPPSIDPFMNGVYQHSIDNGITFFEERQFIFNNFLPNGGADEVLPGILRRQNLSGCTETYITDIAIINRVEPVCDLVLGDQSFTKSNETISGASDGTITINATSSFNIEYSLNNVDFQSSNVFNGLSPGAYDIYIRDNNTLLCEQQIIGILIEAAQSIPDCSAGETLINKRPVNSNNFITWFPVTGLCSDFTSINGDALNCYYDIPTPYRQNIAQRDLVHYPVMAPGEITSFYINFDKAINSAFFSTFKLALINNSGIVVNDIATLNQDFYADGETYNIWADVSNPDVPNGVYHFMIYEENSNAVFYISNQIRMIRDNYEIDTSRLIYRNSTDLYNFKYSDVEDFTNKVRLRIYRKEFQGEPNLDQYRAQSTGRLRNKSSESDKYYVLETYYFDDLAHHAMIALQIHDLILINSKELITKSRYEISWDDKLYFNKGTIEMYDQDFSSCNLFGKPGNITIIDTDDNLLLGDNQEFIRL